MRLSPLLIHLSRPDCGWFVKYELRKGFLKTAAAALQLLVKPESLALLFWETVRINDELWTEIAIEFAVEEERLFLVWLFCFSAGLDVVAEVLLVR